MRLICIEYRFTVNFSPLRAIIVIYIVLIVCDSVNGRLKLNYLFTQ